MNLERALAKDRRVRSIGFDDSPFHRNRPGSLVLVCGVVCNGARFEGMVTTRVRKDGWNATSRVIDTLRDSKFLPQLHLIMFDGIAFGGFNVVDLQAVHDALELPVLSVMRKEPDMEAIRRAVQNLPHPKRRLRLIARAGEVHQGAGCYFQVVGATPDVARAALASATDTGHIPEPVRLAHLIGSAVVAGESGRRA